MRVLHTSDWHIGRNVRQHSRADEHRQLLAEIVEIIAREKIDLVLISGDVFDHSAPSALDEEIAYSALLAFTHGGAQVAMIAGNHDHPDRLEALTPLFKLAGIHSGAKFRSADNGGCIEILTSQGEAARIAMLPWLRRSKLIKADDLMSSEQLKHQSIYSSSWKAYFKSLTERFTAKTVNLVMAHVVFTGAMVGGGERMSETVEGYWVPKQDLDLNGAQYIAIGHIHKQQSLGLTVAGWYCGSPLQLDFGEENDPSKGVLVFEAQPSMPITDVRPIPLTSGRRMLTIPGNNYRNHQNPGSLDHLRKLAASGELGDSWLRIFVNEPWHPGIQDEVRDLLPNAVEIMPAHRPVYAPPQTREGIQPRELLATYFTEHKVNQDGVLPLFDTLLEEELASPSS